MYMRFSALLPVAAIAALVAAAPSELESRNGGVSQCNTGSIDCCNQTFTQNDPTLTALLGLIGVALPDIAGLVGLGCDPITGIGAGSGASCTQQPVCCTGNTYNGLINVGCTPINVNA